MEGKEDNKRSHTSKTYSMYLKAYENIKNAIIFFDFSPGEYLSENSLANLLRMSRTPVREAIKKLSSEGLVIIVPGRGAYVPQISNKDLKDVFELRKNMECLALRTSLYRITNQEIKDMEINWNSMNFNLEKGVEVDWNQISKYDNQLHTLIVERCDNDRLIFFMKILKQQIIRYQYLAAKTLGNASETIKQHLDIIALLQKIDLKGVTKQLEEHLDSSEKIIQEADVLWEKRNRIIM